MRRRLTLRMSGRFVLLIAASILLALAVMAARWVTAAGPHAGWEAMSRLLEHGSTNIDDFRRYPARDLKASSDPYHFLQNAGRFRVPQTVKLDDFEQSDIEAFLQKNDTIVFLIVKDDNVVLERHYQGHTPASLSQFFSLSKSIRSILVGAAIDDGFIRSVDQPVTDFIPELVSPGNGIRWCVVPGSGRRA